MWIPKLPESWYPVSEFQSRYSVSTWGRVRARGKRKVVLKGQIDKDGYRVVTLWDGFRSYRRRVGRMVLETFVRPAPTPQHQCCHGDAGMTDDGLHNVRWGTPSENHYDKLKTGRKCNMKLTRDDVIEIRFKLALEIPMRRIATEFDVSPRLIQKIKNKELRA